MSKTASLGPPAARDLALRSPRRYSCELFISLSLQLHVRKPVSRVLCASHASLIPAISPAAACEESRGGVVALLQLAQSRLRLCGGRARRWHEAMAPAKASGGEGGRLPLV